MDLVYEHFNADPDNAFFFTSNNMLCSREQFLAVGGFDRTFPRAGAEDRDFCDRWRVAGWPLVWRPAARVDHRHSQTLRGFLDLHFRYGRGAWLYQAKRRQRGSGTMRADLGFHAALPHLVRQRLAGSIAAHSGGKIVTALALWQVANAVGFASESLANVVRHGGR